MNRENLPFRRRTVLKATGVAGVLGGTFAGTASADEEPVIEKPDGWDDLSFKKQLKEVRKATKPYRSLAEADADGYVSSHGLLCSHGFAFERERDNVVNPINPHAIDYMISDKKLELAAVEYVVTGDHQEDPPDVFNDEGESLKISEEDGWVFFEGADATALHVWAHTDNPDGLFAPRNSALDDMPGCF